MIALEVAQHGVRCIQEILRLFFRPIRRQVVVKLSGSGQLANLKQGINGEVETLARKTAGILTSFEVGQPLYPTVDHICIDEKLAGRLAAVWAWPAGQTTSGKRLSDHTGVLVDLAEE
jgi:endonuclease/exonuclease/phosphatase family metal-dependent hydrolase